MAPSPIPIVRNPQTGKDRADGFPRLPAKTWREELAGCLGVALIRLVGGLVLLYLLVRFVKWAWQG